MAASETSCTDRKKGYHEADCCQMKSTTSDSQEDEYANASSIQQESGTFEPSELVLGTSNQLKLTAFDSKNMGYITTPFMKEPTNIIKIELFINHEISVKSHHLS